MNNSSIHTADRVTHLKIVVVALVAAIAVAPELSRMKGVRVLCVYGADETGSLCTKPVANSLEVVKLSGGHHFDGNYPKLATLLLSHMH